MGLDMYMYKSTKGQFAARQKYYKEIEKHYEKWNPIFKSYPVKDNGWEFDMDKMTQEQKDGIEKEKKERDAIIASTNYDPETRRDNEIHYWRKFNALHGYIVRVFGGGMDTCQTIEIKDENGSYKAGVKKLLSALKKTKKQLDDGKTENLEMMPTPGFFFGSTKVDDWFITDVKESLEFFQELYDDLSDDDVIFYEASW